MCYKFEAGLNQAEKLDQADPLKDFRQRFYINEGEIYMDGNSLGLCSKDAEAAVHKMLAIWKEHGINMWGIENGKYFLYPSYLGGLLCPLINADPDEVTITNSTTINIHQCLATFYEPKNGRTKILVDDLNFPTDRHAVDSQVLLRGLDPQEAVKVVKSRDGRTIDEEAIIEAMTEDVAVALLPSVLYRSAQLLDMNRLTAAARQKGIIMGWDLCHSIGAVPHNLKQTDADFAIWCNYKHLSAGPGAVAGIYINRRHFGRRPGLAGWQGNVKETLFKLNHKHEHANNADGWLTGTPPMLSMSAMEGVLGIFHEAGMDRIREKSLKITAYLMYLIDERLSRHGFAIGNPREDSRRGGHVALEHSEAYRICQALKNHGVIPDYREPNVIRLAPAALYVSYVDAYNLVDIIDEIAVNKEYEKYSQELALVV